MKQTNIPILVVPEGAKFEQPSAILMAFKNGTFKKNRTLEPVRQFVKQFGAEVKVLHVETPESIQEMRHVSGKLEKLYDSYTKTENATTFQAVLEHFQRNNRDILCVVRRKRRFF
ncbi:hypothetical protein [Candidatus Ulvibacter alkanivorans]|uniref:hypothetical protein n=1 Tax=Candidatus Ulvibacter alkanivorans TaxID=2267620 RepID=UPI001FE80130|nr:hypothetical protein [Candidatus Ulvibacter alkanivorans]